MVLGLCGKSGVGKTTIANELIKSHDFTKLVTYTTRAKRYNEVDGIDYNFITKEEMGRLKSEGKLLEVVEFGSSLYGSPIPPDGRNYIIILEQRGIDTFKKKLGDGFKSVYLDAYACTRKLRLYNSGLSKEEVEIRISRDMDDEVDRDAFDHIIDATCDLGSIVENILGLF